MKKLIIPLILLLAVPALAGWDGWGSSTNNTGLGLFSVDSLAGKKVIASTTTGDSVIVYTTEGRLGSDTAVIALYVNGFRNKLMACQDSAIWAYGITDTSLHRGDTFGVKIIDKYGKIVQFGECYPLNFEHSEPGSFEHDNPWRLGMWLSSGFSGGAEAEDTIYIGASRFRHYRYGGIGGGYKNKWEYQDIMRITKDSVVFSQGVGFPGGFNLDYFYFYDPEYPGDAVIVKAHTQSGTIQHTPVSGLMDLSGTLTSPLGLQALWPPIFSCTNMDSGYIFMGFNTNYWAVAACSLHVRTTDDSALIYTNDKPMRLGSGVKIDGNKIAANVVGFNVYAKGQRPASPSIGDIICIDGDGDEDTLYVYLRGAWQQLK